MTPARRAVAVAAGFTQALIGAALWVASIASIGLVTGEDFSVNWMVVPAALVTFSIGLSVSKLAGHRRWLLVGSAAAVIGAVLAVPAALLTGTLLTGAASVVVIQLLPAMLPDLAHRPA
jgi:hypothetical protein